MCSLPRYQDTYRFVLWVSAASEESLRAAYVTMADHLQLSERIEQEQDKVVAAVRHWLATHNGWLLVVDNADELGTIWSLLPTGNTGIFYSRRGIRWWEAWSLLWWSRWMIEREPFCSCVALVC